MLFAETALAASLSAASSLSLLISFSAAEKQSKKKDKMRNTGRRTKSAALPFEEKPDAMLVTAWEAPR